MSEAQNNVCSDASKEQTEAANGLQGNLVPPAPIPQNPIEEAPSAVCQIPQQHQNNQQAEKV